MVSDDKRATLIAEHYRDSRKALSKQLTTRNKELVWLFALLALTMLNAYYPDLFSKVAHEWLKLDSASNVPLPNGFVGFILLFAVALLVGDIYNLSMAIKQTVSYLGTLERTLASHLGDEIFTRFQTAPEKRPALLTRTALVFGASFSAITCALTVAILWANWHTITKSSEGWFFLLDLLLGVGILYMSFAFIRAYPHAGRTISVADPMAAGAATGQKNS